MVTCSCKLLFCILLYTFIHNVLEARLIESFQKIRFQDKPSFKEEYFDQFIDHFNFKNAGNSTYKQRYLITVQYWKNNVGPIFFYTGNEGDIVVLQNSTCFLTELAEKINAMVIFAEHRYYGTSLPFGEESFSVDHIGFLTMEQALADYAYLIDFLKQKYDAKDDPVIAFGGSYGGQLAAYIRMKYPNLVLGSLAASAPLYWTTGYGDRHDFWKSITEQFGKYNTFCVDRVKEGFAETASLAALNRYSEISQAFKTCQDVTKDNLDHFYGWARNVFTLLAVFNYPYAMEFVPGHYLPAHPVNVACQTILNTSTAMRGLASVVGFLYNATSPESISASVKCFDMSEYVECADASGCAPDSDGKAWDYQWLSADDPPSAIEVRKREAEWIAQYWIEKPGAEFKNLTS